MHARSDAGAFLSEALAGKHERYSEDRLTRLFVASFNASSAFRGVVSKVIEVDVKNSTARAQVPVTSAGGRTGQLDILFERGGAPFALIENKIDDPLTRAQQEKYKKANPKLHYIAICKFLPDHENRLTGWTFRRWGELAGALQARLDEGVADETQHFIMAAFLDHLTEHGMGGTFKIKRSDLAAFAKFLNGIWNRSGKFESAVGANETFQVATSLGAIFETIVREALKDKVIAKHVGAKTRPGIYVGSWWPDEKSDYKPWYGITLDLHNPTSKVGQLSIALQCDGSKYWISALGHEKRSKAFIEPIKEYGPKDVEVEALTKWTLKQWKVLLK